MNREDFVLVNATDIIALWVAHLGPHSSNRYIRFPHMLVSHIKNPESWDAGRIEARIGSRFSEDSKLLVYDRIEGLEFLCYAQMVKSFGVTEAELQEAERAERAFNRAARDYLQSLK